MTETMPDDSGGTETSLEADVDAAYDDSDEAVGAPAGVSVGDDDDGATSHDADVAAGYDDASDSPAGGDTGSPAY